MRSNIIMVTLGVFVTALLIMSGCGGGGTSNSNGSPDNGTPPQIVASVVPSNNTTLSIRPTNITVTFGEAMDSSTITANTFIVTLNGQPVGGTVTYDSTNKTATFTPTSALSTTATYTCTVTTGMNTSTGKSLSSDYVWRFINDTVPSTPVISLTALGKRVTITWPEVQGGSSYNLYWSTTPPNTGSGLSFSHKITNVGIQSFDHNNLTNGDTYYYAITAVNAKGESDYSEVVSTTINISSGPSVVSIYPAANDIGVPIKDYKSGNPLVATATFSSPLALPKPTMTVVDSSGNAVNCRQDYVMDPSSIMCVFIASTGQATSSALEYNKTYTVSITGNLTGNDYSWSFTTASSAPLLTITNIGNNITLSWTPVAEATSYNIYQALYDYTDPRGATITNVTSPYTMSQAFTPIMYNTKYYYVVAMKGSRTLSVSNVKPYTAQ